MKLIISLAIFVCSNASAMIVINSHSEKKANIVSEIFRSKYSIPSNLIITKKIFNTCPKCEDFTVVCLCINKKGELKLLSFDMKTLKKSYDVFQIPARGKE